MAKVKIQGHASGTGVLTVTAPNTSTDRTITLPDATGTLLNSDGSGANLTNLPSDVQVSATAPSSPSEGDLWFNSASSAVGNISSKAMAVYNGTSWNQMSNLFSATGGTVTSYSGYKSHTFTSSGTFVADVAGTVDIMIVAGGGGGGGRWHGGGGGA